jgi:hypothetical protein
MDWEYLIEFNHIIDSSIYNNLPKDGDVSYMGIFILVSMPCNTLHVLLRDKLERIASEIRRSKITA